MSSLAEIQDEILRLPPGDQAAIREWVLQQIKKTAPSFQDRPLNDVLPRFQDMVTHLTIQWQMYDDLFRADHYPLFNQTASTFFYHLRWYLFDGLIVSISRFLDPPGNRHQEILSLERICLFPELAGLKVDLLRQLEQMRAIAEPGIKFWRNNICSHANLPTVLREKEIPSVQVEHLRNLVAGISAFAGQVTLALTNVGQESRVDTGWHWVSRLLEDLDAGNEQRKARLAEQKKRLRGE